MYKPKEEFVVGKYSIGYVDSDFLPRMGDAEFSEKQMPTFQKLGKRMTDAEIEAELKPGFCDLGDVLAFIKNAPEECKDGWANLFYFPSFVVDVRFPGSYWYVDSFYRRDDHWFASARVFSPAKNSSTLSPSVPLKLETLTLDEILVTYKLGKISLEEAKIALRIEKKSRPLPAKPKKHVRRKTRGRS